jgi:methyl-accepting chemotaxis protein
MEGLTKSGDEVRRVAKQTSRAVAEQGDALTSLAATAAKQSGAIGMMARLTTEQATAAREITTAAEAMRGSSREIVAAAAQQAKTSTMMAGDVSSVAAGVAKIRSANLEQADAVESLTTILNALREMEDETSQPAEPA